MSDHEDGKVVGTIPPTADVVAEAGTTGLEQMADELNAQSEADRAALRSFVDWLKATRNRVLNRIRMAICNALGITYAMQQLNLRAAGTRMDLDKLSEASMKNAEILEKVVGQLNAHTEVIQCWEGGFPLLRKLSSDMRASLARAQKRVMSNGNGKGLVGADGRPIIKEPEPEPPIEPTREG